MRACVRACMCVCVCVCVCVCFTPSVWGFFCGSKVQKCRVSVLKRCELCRVLCFIVLMKPKQLGPCVLRLGSQNSTEAILASQ